MSIVSSKEQFIKAYVESYRPAQPHVAYHKMMSRLLSEQTAVLPIQSGDQVFWLVLQADKKTGRDHAKEIQHFIGNYCKVGHADHRMFVTGKSALHETGVSSYPSGYYIFRSTSDRNQSIWDMLNLWLELDEKRPILSPMDTEYSAFTLRNMFQEQVATEQWDAAQSTLEIIRQGHYVSEENYLFLKIQWLGAQHEWEKVWYSKDFEIISHLDYVPSRIQHFLLKAAYSTLARSDADHQYLISLKAFTQTRYRLGNLLQKFIASNEEPVCRLKAYNAFVESDHEGLERLLTLVTDETTISLIHFLMDRLSPSQHVTITIEEKVQQAFFSQRYDDAYHDVKASLLSPFKVKYLCKIATMTDADLVYQEAKTALESLSAGERQLLLQDPECRADLLLVQARMSPQPIVSAQPQNTDTIHEVTWHGWFSQFIEYSEKTDQLQQQLRTIDTTRGGMVWTDNVLSQMAEQFAELAMMSLTGNSRSLLETGLSMFMAELTDPEHFPQDQALSLYDYCSELMMAQSKKNKATMVYFQKLSEGLLHLDFTLASTQFQRMQTWFDISPSKMALPYLQTALELYFDYGISQQQLVNLWNDWSGTLGESLLTMEPFELENWCELGKLMGADDNLLHWLRQHLEQQGEVETDVFTGLPPMKIAIFTLREHTAKRAVEKLLARNSQCKYVLCTDDALTAEAKAHVKSADIVVIVTTCLSHAIFYGIQSFLRENVVYPRSSGTSGILAAIEEYVKKKYDS